LRTDEDKINYTFSEFGREISEFGRENTALGGSSFDGERILPIQKTLKPVRRVVFRRTGAIAVRHTIRNGLLQNIVRRRILVPQKCLKGNSNRLWAFFKSLKMAFSLMCKHMLADSHASDWDS
jgi:hypothetical protein